MINNTTKDFAREIFAVDSSLLCKEIQHLSVLEENSVASALALALALSQNSHTYLPRYFTTFDDGIPCGKTPVPASILRHLA